MANPILQLTPPVFGLSAIVNVSNKVGPKQVNTPADVRIVQRLIQMATKGVQNFARIGIPNATGIYDAATGFYIYHMQNNQRRGHLNFGIDGIISPARATGFSGAETWALIHFNSWAKERSGPEFAAFLASGGTT